MFEQFDTQKPAADLWVRCLGVYCAVLFLILLGLLFAEYTLEEPALALSAYEALPSSSQVLLVGMNSASSAELQSLPRIGPVLAQAIIDYRTEKGRFDSVEQLLEVRGIGENTLEEIRPFISLD